MKKTLLVIICLLSFWTKKVDAQITLDYSNDSLTYGGEFYCTDIGEDEFKYVVLNQYNNSFSLYNMDMSLFMEIQNPVSDSIITQGFTVIYIHRTLFDCDPTNIEYVLTNPNDLNLPFRVIRADGTVIFEVDSATVPYCFGCYGGAVDIKGIINTSEGTKLFLQKRNLQWGTGIQTYSLCGKLPMKTIDLSFLNEQNVKIYPNPTTGNLNFQINLPDNKFKYELIIFDGNSKEIKRESIYSNKINYSIDVSNFSSGTYFYSLRNENGLYKSGKFILTN